MSENTESHKERTERWNPEDHDPIGECLECGGLVYPAGPNQVDADAPVLHEGCGW